MLVYAAILLIGALTMSLLVWAGLRVRTTRRRTYATQTDHGAEPTSRPKTTGTFQSQHVGTIAENVSSVVEDEGPAWKRYEEAVNGGMSNVYRTRPTFSAGGARWDPYDESQSRARRAQAARRKPRPQRVPVEHEPRRSDRRRVDLYVLLGVPRQATRADIERAFRIQVAQFHPDRFHNDPEGRSAAEERLKQLNMAMEVLRDTKRRAHYDLTRAP